MCVSGKHITDIPFLVDDSSTLISQRYDRTRPSKSGKGPHKCDHCDKLGHKIDRFYALHGRPLRSVTVAQNVPVQHSTLDPTSSDISGQPAILNEFLKWYEDRQNFGSTASIAHSGTPFVGLTHSNSLGPWVINSGVIDHITGNKSFFSSLSTYGYLPTITMENGFRVSSHGVGTTYLLPSLYIDNVLYVLGYPFNLLSISHLTPSFDCVISLTEDSICLQDRCS